jgi:hypothetical protein
MAEGKGTGRGLNLRAKLDVGEAKKNAMDLLKVLKDLKIASSAATTGNNGSASKAFDVKPLTEYQAGLLKIKQEALELAKQNAADKKARQEQADVERSASLATQAALKEEARLKREQIALAKQAAAEANKKKPTQVSNSQAEIDAYKKAQQGSLLYTSAINAERMARAQANTEAAKAAIANGNLNSGTVYNTNATNQQTEATNKNVLSKKQLAQMLAEEKLRQADATRELKNNAREMLNAKGSIEQRRAALIRLTTVYDRLNKAERESASGKRLEGIIKGLVGQIGTLEQATGRAQRGVGGYAEGISAFFKSIAQNILSGLGPLALLTTAIAAAKAAFSHNVEISDAFVDVQRTAKLSGEEVDRLADKLKRINTRTSLEGLLDIGFIGGRLGVAKDDLVGFITEVDKLAVVLKKEFPGGAEAVATSLGKIISVYKITQKEGITLEDALRKTGSAFLELSHNGGAPVQYLQDFALGTAGIAQVTKLTLPTLLSYGSVLSKAGVQASTAATGVTRFLSDLSTKREKYFAIAQLADSTLTIEKFTNLINTDAKVALDLFFKGLKAGNPTTTEMGDRLKTLSLTAGKVKNTVIALAEAQDTLFTSVKLINRAYDEGTSVNHNFELANNSLAASFEKIKNGIVNYFTSASNGRGLAELLNSFTDTRTESEKLAEEYTNNKHRIEELEGALKPLTTRYDELQVKVKEVGGVSKLTKMDQDSLRDVTAQIGAILPGVTTKFDDFGNAISISRDRINELTKAQKDLMVAMNRKAINTAGDEFNEFQRKAALQAKNLAEMSKNVGKTQGFRTLSNSDVRDENDRLVILKGQAYAAAKAVRDLGGTLTVAQKKVIDYYEAIDKAKKPGKKNATIIQTDGAESDSDVGRTITDIKKDIKDLTEANKKLGIQTAAFKANRDKLIALRKELKIANGGKDTEGIAQENQYASALKARNDLQEQISALTKKGTDKQLSADEQELESVRDKYKKMAEAAAAFNKDPKNKGLKVNASGLLTAQSQEEDAVRDKQDTAKLKNTLDEQKKLYDAYEEYKTKVGDDKAKERYGKLIDTDRTYLESLQAQEAELLNPQKSKGGAEGKASALKIKLLGEEIAAEKVLVQKKDDDIYAYAYQAAMTNAQKLAEIERDYQLKRKALGKDASAEQIANLDKEKNDRILNQNEANAYQLSGYEELMRNYDELTRKQLIKALNAVKEKNRAEYASGKITAEQLAKLNGDVDNNLANLNKENPFAALTQALEDYKKTVGTKDSVGKVKAFEALTEAAQGAAEYVSKAIESIEDDLNNAGLVSDGLQKVIDGAKKTIAGVKGIIGGASQIGSGLASGNPVAVVTGSIKLLTSAISIFGTKDAKLQKQIDNYKKQLGSLGTAYKQLERDTTNAVGNEIYSKQAQEIDNLKAQQAALTKMRDAESSKKKKDQGKIDDMNNQIADIPGKIEDIQKSISQNLIQGTFQELSNSLADALTAAFKAGEDGIDAMNETFDDFITKAIANSLKLAILEPVVAAFTKELTSYAQGHGNSVVGFDFDAWRKKLNDAGETFNKGLKEANVVGGVSDGTIRKIDDIKADIKKIEDLKRPLDTTSDQYKEYVKQLVKLKSELKIANGQKADPAEGISGKVVGEAITEGTANRLLGITLAQHDSIKLMGKTIGDTYKVAVNHFTVSVEIAANTLRTANNTDGIAAKLDKIVENTSGSDDLGQVFRNAGIK